VIAIIATVAKQERLRISERVKAGLATARRKGQRLGRPRVYVNPDKIAALREGGASWTQVCSSLNLSKGVAQRAWAAARSNGR
jgi:DNA invertase Pin-like site-specific DNA recombinase